MRILIVCSGTAQNFDFKIHQAFIYDQVESIKRIVPNIEFDYFFIKRRGIIGYIFNYRKLRCQLKESKFDLIHAHYSYSALLANFQRRIKVICTFHGSDINCFKNRILSLFAEYLSKGTIYVSKKLYSKALIKIVDKDFIIPCGVSLDIFKLHDKNAARELMGLKLDMLYILFSASFNDKVKNYNLLKQAISIINDTNIEIIELKNFSRKEVAQLMNAVDLCVMTSFYEGSPQFIKEAMACNCPIVATDVGDIKEVISNTDGCYITTFDPEDVAKKIKIALAFGKRTDGRERIQRFDNKQTAVKVYNVYQEVLAKPNGK